MTPTPRIAYQLRIQEPLYQLLQQQAAANGMSMNAWMLRLLEFGAKREEDGT